MEHSNLPFISLLIVVGLSFLVPIIMSRFNFFYIPIVIGEIIAGVIAGKSGFNFVVENHVLNILSELGFIFLMFLSGLEIDFSEIQNKPAKNKNNSTVHWTQNPLMLGLTAFALSLILSCLASWKLQKAGLIQDVWLMALILSTTSLGVVMPVLKENELSEQYFGRMLLVSTIIADFGSIFLTSVYVLFLSEGLTSEILLILVLLAAFAAIYRISQFLQKHFPIAQFFDRISSATSQIRLRGSLALALFFIVIAESLGTENILGAFLAGVIVSMLSKSEGSILRKKLDAVGYGFFIPIFFIMVGINFDIWSLLSSRSAILLTVLLLVIAFGVKIVSALIYRIAVSWRETLAAGLILSSRLSLIIAVSAIGVRIGIVSDEVNGAIILVALVTCLLSPVLFNVFAPEHPEKPYKILVVGCRQSVEMLAPRLREKGLEIIVLCSSNLGAQERSDGNQTPPIQMHKQISWIIQQQDIKKISTIVMMEEADDDNLRLCRVIRKRFGFDNIISWVNDPARNPEFRKLGVRIVNPSYSTLLIMENLALNPGALSLTSDLDKSMSFKEIKIKDNELAGRSISDFMLPKQVSILMIRRMGETITPQIDTVLRSNDVLTLAGMEKELEKVIRNFYPNRED